MKLALGVAINKYIHEDSNLNGCVNDWNNFKNTIIELGFPKSYIRQVTNRRATKDAIIKRLKAYTSFLTAGDTFIFFYSGHGAQIINRGKDKELDNRDEIILPTDYIRGNYLYDDEIYEVISSLPEGLNFIFFSDSCYSETQYRLLKPVHSSFDIVKPKSLGTFISNKSRLKKLLEHKCNLFTFSAARDIEPALEVQWGNGKIAGLFTTLFCKKVIQEQNKNVNLIEEDINRTIDNYKINQQVVFSSPEVTFKELING